MLLIIWTLFFFSHLPGEEKKITPQLVGGPAEVIAGEMQISSEVSRLVGLNWFRSCLIILNVLEPVKQFDLSGDHDKNWYTLHSRFLHSRGEAEILVQQQICRIFKYMRLLIARYINGFYIYSLEKLLI